MFGGYNSTYGELLGPNVLTENWHYTIHEVNGRQNDHDQTGSVTTLSHSEEQTGIL